MRVRLRAKTNNQKDKKNAGNSVFVSYGCGGKKHVVDALTSVTPIFFFSLPSPLDFFFFPLQQSRKIHYPRKEETVFPLLLAFIKKKLETEHGAFEKKDEDRLLVFLDSYLEQFKFFFGFAALLFFFLEVRERLFFVVSFPFFFPLSLFSFSVLHSLLSLDENEFFWVEADVLFFFDRSFLELFFRPLERCEQKATFSLKPATDIKNQKKMSMFKEKKKEKEIFLASSYIVFFFRIS